MNRLTLLVVALTFALGCGATIHDPCTTEADCGGQICLNDGFAPGGYCSKPCTIGVEDSCPGGTVCVRDALNRDQPGCLRACVSANDCRKGYECTVFRDSPRAVCVGINR